MPVEAPVMMARASGTCPKCLEPGPQAHGWMAAPWVLAEDADAGEGCSFVGSLRETVGAADELDPSTEPEDLLTRLGYHSNRARDIVPDLVGVSAGRIDDGLAYTLVETSDEIAAIDGVQYVAGGPCVEAAQGDEVREFGDGDVLDEERWRLFAEATAAAAARSTLSLPVLTEDRVVGAVVNADLSRS